MSTGMHTAMQVRRLFILAPAAILALYTSAAHAAEPQAAVTVSVYNNYGYNQSPPLPDESRLVGTTYDVDIWHSFDQQPLFGMYEDFVVRYDTNITASVTADVSFMALADDGTLLYVDNKLVSNDWVDKGGGGSVSVPVAFEAGVSKPLTLWFYENGGGAWVELWWNIEGEWQIVPPSAYTAIPVAPETTTTTVTTTTTTTTTTEPPTTTTATTTTTTVYAPPTTNATTTSVTTTPSTIQPTTTTSPIIETTTIPPAPTTTQPLDTILDETLDSDTATQLATNASVIGNATAEQAQQIFAAVDIGELSDSEAAAIVAAVQGAPVEVRAAFEQEIDIYAGKTDSYIPLGSLVNVATRRVLVVSVAFTIATPIPPSRRSL